jgi:hypothetical protein
LAGISIGSRNAIGGGVRPTAKNLSSGKANGLRHDGQRFAVHVFMEARSGIESTNVIVAVGSSNSSVCNFPAC